MEGRKALSLTHTFNRTYKHMNARTLIAATALVAATTIAAPAMAGISTGNLGVDVQSAVGSGGNVNVRLVGGIATLSGDVNDVSTKAKVRQAALAHPDVNQVIDRITY